ncbi:MAG: hypothetical protein Q8O89_03740, partial [Nanoarchaeota archaeon]|nr:hypothetical protein [Nanoarchaeota archaeon]
MALFGNQQIPPEMAMQGAAGSLVEQVMQLRGQGMPNSQIVQMLISQGNNYPDVFNAMSQADMMSNQATAGAPMMTGGPIPQQPQNQMQQPQQMQQSQETNKEKIEEIAEAIIEEKWNELVKNMNKVIEWKSKTDAKIAQIEQQLKDTNSNFEELHRGILGKVGEYDKSIQDVGTELKAMGKVFEKIIPTLSENVNELSRLT